MYDGFFYILARTVQVTFIGLVGISLALSFIRGKYLNVPVRVTRIKNFKRGMFIILFGYIISLVTFMVIPERFVSFGILHLIGFGVLFFTLLAQNKYTNLILGLILTVLAIVLKFVQIPQVDKLNYLIYSIGLNGWEKGLAIDYFPIVPWFAVIALGVFLGHLLYYKYPLRRKAFVWFDAFFTSLSEKTFNFPMIILFLGRHSLFIYLVHIPIILLLLVAFNILNFDLVFKNS